MPSSSGDGNSNVVRGAVIGVGSTGSSFGRFTIGADSILRGAGVGIGGVYGRIGSALIGISAYRIGWYPIGGPPIMPGGQPTGVHPASAFSGTNATQVISPTPIVSIVPTATLMRPCMLAL
jgi:hypothetical protein